MRNKPLRRQYRAADVGTEGKKMKSAAAIKRRLLVPNYARETIENRAAVAAETSPGTRSRSDVTRTYLKITDLAGSVINV